MNSERWQKVKGLFDVVVELAPAERERFLTKACGADERLRREVEKLLDSFEEAESFMEQPAALEVVSVIIKTEAKNIEAGKCFGHYEIVRQIGAGGMGEVYLARDKQLERQVAVKILNEKFAAHESNLERFTKEAKAASALNHPNILVIHEIGESDNANYIVSEFVEGETLRDAVRKSPMKLPEVLDISIQIAAALAAAHAAHIVHRDIKPENIIVRPDGYVKILDFGLAKLVGQKVIGLEDETARQNETAKGIILGTVNYMSPEQAKGERIDERTDIFSFGVLIYEIIAGRTPFAGDSMSETFANLINAEPQPLVRFAANVPDEMQRIVAKMLRKNKDERYQTMKDLLADLTSLQKRLNFEAELRRSSSPVEQREAGTEETEQTKTQTNSIAVLPFANMSNDAENEFFCDGLAEELLNALAKIKDLKVAARTSAFSFKNKNIEVSEIGNALNVKTILEGSVRKAGNRLRISVQLINAASGFHIWSERYDGEMKDVFDLQDEITLAVIDELKVKFLSEEKAALRNRYDENVEAYQLYLKGRYHYLKLRPAEIQIGISYFERAIEIDSSYALAYVGLAQAYQTLPLAAEFPAAEFSPKARAAALRAIEIDDNLAEAHGVLGWLLFWFDWDWKAAERECRRAFELNPKSADAHEAYAHLLSNTGRHAESLAEIKLARELDPLNLRVNALEGQFLLHAGQTDKALERLKKTFELEPNFWLAHLFAASVYIEKEMFAEAAAEADKAKQLSGGSSHAAALGVYALAKSGKQIEAQAALAEMLKLSTSRYVPPYHYALAYQGLDERDEIFNWLEKACEQHDPKIAFLKVEPKWNSLRSDSRFQNLLGRVGFPTDETAQRESGDTANRAKITGANSPLSDARLDASAKAITDLTAQSPTSKMVVSSIRKNQKFISTIGLVIFLIAAVGFGYYFLPAKKSASSAVGKKSLAVLPFVNASQDQNAEYLSDGITESIINNLSQLSGLRVMSRNSAFRFKNNQTDTRAIALQLGVETLVTGDIKQIGDRLVINISLINASDDSQIWGNQYVKTSGDVIVAQNEIARDVSLKLGARLSGADERQLAKKDTENPEAYQLFLKGRYYFEKGAPQDSKKSGDYFGQAIALDPNFALAYAYLSAFYNHSREPLKAKEAALKAISLDDQLPTGHIALGDILEKLDYDFVGAEREYKRALELDPNDASARESYGLMLSSLGKHEEALAELRLAAEIDPLAPGINTSYGISLLRARQYDEAVAQYKKSLELNAYFIPAHNGLAVVYQMIGNYAESVEERAKISEIDNNPQTAAFMRKSFANGGWQGFLREMTGNGQAPKVPPYVLATFYAELGEKDKAFGILNKLYEDHNYLAQIKVDPRFDSLRDDARFTELLKKMNLE